jgi:hypothetical protein
VSFSTDISKFVKKTGLRADLVVRKLGLDAYAGVLKRSPVDTGRFRGSWRVAVGGADGSVNPPVADPPGGGKARSSGPQNGSEPDGRERAYAEAKLLAAKFGKDLVISNNLPYAIPLERGPPSPTSKQAPTGVLRVTRDDVFHKFAETVKSVSG